MPSLLQGYVLEQAEGRSGAVAVVMGHQALTYGELEESSNRLARLLKDAGCRRGDRVCLFTPKAPAALTGMLAALKADCAYVPVDIASPALRVAKVVASAEPRVVLAGAAATKLLGELVIGGSLGDDVPIGCLDADSIESDRFAATFMANDAAAYSAEPVDATNSQDDLAHILFTSGSTGTPKGVMITHANVMAFVEWAVGYFGTTASDRISGHPPLHFDLSTFDVYATFKAGAELHLVPPQVSLLPRELARLIVESGLTQWFSVPSVMTYMAKAGVVEPGCFPTLGRVLWCGEVLPTPVLRHWMQCIPQATFTNLYGPTETTIASSFHTLPQCPRTDTEPIPIGQPCTGEELAVLDDELRPLPPGEMGNLYVGGVGLSPGYWRDPELTAKAFVAQPGHSGPDARTYRTGDLARLGDDGLFYFLGRADSQIKSRGYRIELGEIETALNSLGGLKECAVVGVDTAGFEGTTICCAFVPLAQEVVTPAAIRTELRTLLPSYMLPSRWMVFDALPKNVNGKIDRRRLGQLFGEQDGAEGDG